MTAGLSDTKTHISNIGRMIEDMETDMRSNMNELYILKTREIVCAPPERGPTRTPCTLPT